MRPIRCALPLSLLLCAALPAGLRAQDSGAEADPYWPRGNTLDFGAVDARGVERYDTAWLANPTEAPFVIENVRPSCGCTAVAWPRGAVAPGALVGIPVAFRCTRGGYVERHLDVWLSHLRGRERVTVVADCPPR